jgi:hypothetical protein
VNKVMWIVGFEHLCIKMFGCKSLTVAALSCHRRTYAVAACEKITGILVNARY